MQRPFDSNLKVDGNRLATFLNYVSSVCVLFMSCILLVNFIFIERWAWCFQKVRHWKSLGDFIKLRKYERLAPADWRLVVAAAQNVFPSFTSGWTGRSIRSGSILDLDWLTSKGFSILTYHFNMKRCPG